MYLQDSYLSHYGVLGMKWGIRRARKLNEKAARYRRVSEQYSKMNKINKAERASQKATQYTNRANKKINYHKTMAGNKTYNQIKNKTSLGAAIGAHLLYGGAGAVKYYSAKAQGKETKAAVMKALPDAILTRVAGAPTAGWGSVAYDMIVPRVRAKKGKTY